LELPSLELSDIQGDILIGLQKNAECFVFFKIAKPDSFKRLVKLHVAWRITSAWRANHQEQLLAQRGHYGRPPGSFIGLNLGFTRDGLTRLLGAGRPSLDPSFERGAENPTTTEGSTTLPSRPG
jgi:hypothetical protein